MIAYLQSSSDVKIMNVCNTRFMIDAKCPTSTDHEKLRSINGAAYKNTKNI